MLRESRWRPMGGTTKTPPLRAADAVLARLPVLFRYAPLPEGSSSREAGVVEFFDDTIPLSRNTPASREIGALLIRVAMLL